MEHFKSGWKKSYYGKGDVTVYRLHRDGQVPAGRSPVFGASVLLLIYGDAFWPTYTGGASRLPRSARKSARSFAWARGEATLTRAGNEATLMLRERGKPELSVSLKRE